MPAFVWQVLSRIRTQVMVAPSIAILAWSKSLKANERGTVEFALTVPTGQHVVSIVATLLGVDGTFESTVSAIDANAVTGLRLPLVPPGKYRLTMQIRDDLGGSDTTALKRDVVVS